MDEKIANILLVEDEEAHAELVRRSFEPHASRFSLKVATNLKQAKNYLTESTPDLVITDFLLPDGKGIDLLQKEEEGYQLPLVVMTSHGDEQVAVEAMKNGALDYVVKSEAILAGMPHVAVRALREWGYKKEYKRTEEALRESEARYRALYDNMIDGIAVYETNDGEDFLFVDLNRSGEKISRITKGAVIGKNVAKTFPGVKDFGLLEVFQRVFRTGKPERYPIAMYEDERVSHWAENSVYKLPSGEIVAVYSDETERKKAEEALRESEEKYRSLIENVPGMVYRGGKEDGKWTTRYMGPRVEEISGYSSEEFEEGKIGWLEIVHPHDRKRIVSESLKLDHAPISMTQEYRIRRKDGSIVWVRDYKTSIFRDGDFVCVDGVVFDITQEKQAEESLRDSEEKYRNLVDNVGIGVSLISPDMEILTLNNQMKQWFHWVDETQKPICYRAFNDPPRDEICSYCPTKKTLKDGQRHEAVTETPGKEGIRHYRIISTPNKDRYGKITCAIEIVEDITDRKIAEQALRKREAELEARSHDLAEVNAALRVLLKQVREDKKGFQENVLSNVKQLVLPYLERLKTGRLNKDQMHLVGILESNLNNIISPFVGKLSSKFLSLSPMEIRVADLVKEGKANKEMAELLCLSKNTIMFHRKNLRTKLGLKKKGINLRSYLQSLEE